MTGPLHSEWAGHCVTAARGESAETAATCSTDWGQRALQTAAVTSHTDTLGRSQSQPLAKAVSGVKVLSEDTESSGHWGHNSNIDIQDWRTVISSSDLVTQSEGGNFSQVEFRTRGECYSQVISWRLLAANSVHCLPLFRCKTDLTSVCVSLEAEQTWCLLTQI